MKTHHQMKTHHNLKKKKTFEKKTSTQKNPKSPAKKTHKKSLNEDKYKTILAFFFPKKKPLKQEHQTSCKKKTKPLAKKKKPKTHCTKKKTQNPLPKKKEKTQNPLQPKNLAKKKHKNIAKNKFTKKIRKKTTGKKKLQKKKRYRLKKINFFEKKATSKKTIPIEIKKCSLGKTNIIQKILWKKKLFGKNQTLEKTVEKL